jgi:hypothetical protein
VQKGFSGKENKKRQGNSPSLKVVSNEKVGGPGMCQSVPVWLGPRRSRFVALSILLSFSILSISASAPVKQNE